MGTSEPTSASLVIPPNGTVPKGWTTGGLGGRQGEEALAAHVEAMESLLRQMGLKSATDEQSHRSGEDLALHLAGGEARRRGWHRPATETALVVARPRDVLLPGATLMLASAWDLEAEDRDLFATQLQGNALLLNEAQRLAWGPSLHQVNRGLLVCPA